MSYIGKIWLLLLIACLTAGFTQDGRPFDATIWISSGAAAVGTSVHWEQGTLTYKKRDYPVSVTGLSLDQGASSNASASGTIFHLNDLKEFDGNYTSVGAPVTLEGGRSAVTLKNHNGVRLRLISTKPGASIVIASGGVHLKLKK